MSMNFPLSGNNEEYIFTIKYRVIISIIKKKISSVKSLSNTKTANCSNYYLKVRVKTKIYRVLAVMKEQLVALVT